MDNITVIVTVYNRLDYLRNIFICLMSQTVKPNELIIADDGSSENVLNYIGDLIPKCEFKIKHVYQKDMGFRKSRSCNNAVRESEGNYLIFLDQDAIFPNDFLEKVIQNKKRGYFSILRVIWSEFEEKEKIQDMIVRGETYENYLSVLDRSHFKKLKKWLIKDIYNNIRFKFGLRDRGTGLMGVGFAIHKDDYINVNGYDEEYEGWGGEDADLGYRLYTSGIKSRTFSTKLPAIHLSHTYDSTKTGDKNKTLYNTKKKNIDPNNYNCKYGYSNTKGEDSVKVSILN